MTASRSTGPRETASESASIHATSAVVRMPVRPFSTLLALSEELSAVQAAAQSDAPADALDGAIAADRARIRTRLKALIADAATREAVVVASPSLAARLDAWSHGQCGDDDARGVERALLAYAFRMGSRPTPFGLFAGYAVAAVGERSCLDVTGGEWRRHVRFDAGRLDSIVTALSRMDILRRHLRYWRNTSLYFARRTWYYIERRHEAGHVHNRLVALPATPHLDAALEAAAVGGSHADIVDAVLATQTDVATAPASVRAEAEAFVDSLADGQILEHDLVPPVTGDEPLAAVIDRLGVYPGTSAWRRALADVAGRLLGIEHGEPIALHTEGIKQSLAELPAHAATEHLLHVHLSQCVPHAAIGHAVVDDIAAAIDVLRACRRRRQHPLQEFATRFEERFGDDEVRLVDALDHDNGIAFGEVLENAPALAADLDLSAPAPDRTLFTTRAKALLDIVQAKNGLSAEELVLDAADLARLRPPYDGTVLPDAFSATVAIAAASDAAIDRGEFRLLVKHVTGPSGARVFGRFTGSDDRLRRDVEQHLRAEEASAPDAIFAEVIYTPQQPRLGNVVWRPVLRTYEIPFLGRAGVPPERTIPIDDLMLSVRQGRIVLRSRRLKRVVVPRMSNALNYTSKEHPVLYQFLCALQEQGLASPLFWEWEVLAQFDYLPRVRVGRVVLARASWRVRPGELADYADPITGADFRRLQRWRHRRRLPRFASWVDGDRELTIDFDNVVSVELFLKEMRGQHKPGMVQELFPGPDDLAVRDRHGAFVSEIVVPLLRTRRPEPRIGVAARPVSGAQDVPRVLPPGSDWLFVKIYAGPIAAERVLLDVVRPLVRQFAASGAISRWFFVRYHEPSWHIRWRLCGPPDRLTAEVLPAIQTAAGQAIANGFAWRLQIDTYEREIERYGGPSGILAAEAIFHADSEAVIERMETWQNGGSDVRWRDVIAGIDGLLQDFGLTEHERREFTGTRRQQLERLFDFDIAHKRRLGMQFRRLRNAVSATLQPSSAATAGRWHAALRHRSDRAAAAIRQLRAAEADATLGRPIAELIGDLVHMHVNRVLRPASFEQELALYDLLHRHYDERIARAARSRSAPDADAIQAAAASHR